VAGCRPCRPSYCCATVRATGTRRTCSPAGWTCRSPPRARRRPDVVHTSLLRRAISTANIALDAADRHWIPVKRDWRLNERHYGALQGKDKKQTLEQYGEEQFMLWRRSYDTPPPAIEKGSEFSQDADPRYAGVDAPLTECLADVVDLDGISDADIAGLNIPTGIPLVYDLDDDLTPTNPGGRYLDPAAAQEAIAGVANQGR
jgi:2,3-bisphosphoglycerate-dependent phosphoglycerate mutase